MLSQDEIYSNTYMDRIILDFKNILLSFILIKEALTDSPLFIIKENSNCGDFLNNDRFNFLTDRINYNPLTSFTINKRLYKKPLFHMFSQDEIYSNTYMDRIILDFKNLLTSLTLIEFIMTALIPLLLSKSTKMYREKFVLLQMFFLLFL